MKLYNSSLFFLFPLSQNGNFTKAEVLPAAPPAGSSAIGQSSFVDFGENDKNLLFIVICDTSSVLVNGCYRLTERSTVNLALGIWFVIRVGIQNGNSEDLRVVPGQITLCPVLCICVFACMW